MNDMNIGQETTKTIKSKERKTRIVGTQEMMNVTTGEIIDCNVVTVEERDFNFQKLWMGHILEAIDEIGNAKMKVLMYLINKREKANNMLAKTIKEIAKETGISEKTIIETLKILEQHKIIKRKTGVVILNPDVIFKGGPNKRLNVLLQYHNLDENQESETIISFQEEAEKRKNKKTTEEIIKRKAELLAELAELEES